MRRGTNESAEVSDDFAFRKSPATSDNVISPTDHCGLPNMTLQQLRTQITLSLGAR